MTIRPNTPASRWTPSRRPFSMDPRVLFAALALAAIAIGIAVGAVPLAAGLAVTVAFSVFVIFGFIGRKRRFRDFERAFARALQQSAEAAAELYDRAWAVRLFTPRALLLSKVGLVELERAHYAAAEDCFERAWMLLPREHRNPLIAPLVHAKAGAGRWSDVLVLAQEWVDRSMAPANARVFLAAAILQTSEPEDARRRAEALLEAVEGGLSADAMRLLSRLRAKLEDSGDD